jgi:hypothetical protein
MRPAILALTLLLVAQPGAVQAQRLSDPVFARLAAASPTSATGLSAAAIPSVKPTSPAVLALGGVLGGAAGAFAGGIIGAKATDTCEDCALVGLAYGFVAGGSAALPLGVHLANHRRGNYGLSLLASLAIAAAGFGTTLATHDARPMIAVPVLQLVSSIAIERATTR